MRALGPETVVLTSLDALRHHLDADPATTSSSSAPPSTCYSALALAESLRVSRPSLGVILLRRRVDTSVLHDALRAGVREVVDERDLRRRRPPYAGPGRSAARMREQSGSAAAQDGRRHGRIVTVFSAKGGCGKTTLATNLGVALAERGTARGLHRRSRSRVRRRCHRPAGCYPCRTIADAVPLADSIDGPTLSSLLTVTPRASGPWPHRSSRAWPSRFPRIW